MNYDDKACYIFYQTFLRDIKTKRYHLELKVSHFCTPRGMRGILKFNVSIGPDQVPGEGIYEDTGIQVDLNKGKMQRNSGHILNALKNVKSLKQQSKQSSTVPPVILPPLIPQSIPDEYSNDEEDSRDDEGIVPENGKCEKKNQCKYGFRCANSKQQAYCDKLGPELESWGGIRTGVDIGLIKNCGEQAEKMVEGNVNVLGPDYAHYDPTKHCELANNDKNREGSGPDKRGIGCTRDYQCRFDEFCAYNSGECRKNEFMLNGEQCYLNRECLPGANCESKKEKGVKEWGICKLWKTYNQNAEEPNDSLE